MDWTRFILVIAFGEWLIFLQALFSNFEGYFSQRQMSLRGHVGYSFLQHGGMWADIFIVTPLVAYLIAKYQFAYFSPSSIEIATVALVVWTVLAVFVFAPAVKRFPEAHAHGGQVTMAGWIHVVYATLMVWIIAMVYIPNLATPMVSKSDITIVSILLIPWAITGVMKFTQRWKFDIFATTIVVAEIIGIIVLAWWRL